MAKSHMTQAQKRIRPNLKTKEELIGYLNENRDFEPSFVPELWDRCVELCKANEKKDDPTVITNPTTQYFKMYTLTQYRKKANEIRNEEDFKNNLENSNNNQNEQQITNDMVNLDNTDAIVVWMKQFVNKDERNYLLKRYADYFDQYEVNDGADKVLLKRILSCEIELHRIDLLRANGNRIDLNNEKKMTDLLQNTLESMKWTKKQRNARDDMAQNKFTVWMDKQVEDGGFEPVKHTYAKDDIDFLLEAYVSAVRGVLS